MPNTVSRHPNVWTLGQSPKPARDEVKAGCTGARREEWKGKGERAMQGGLNGTKGCEEGVLHSRSPVQAAVYDSTHK